MTVQPQTLPPGVPTGSGPTPSATVGAARPRRLGRLGVYVTIGLLAVIYVYPFLIAIATSFKTDPDAASNPASLIPVTWTTAAYQRLFSDSDFLLWTGNSVLITVCVTLGRMFFDSIAGYALARLHFRGRGLLFAAVVAVMAVPGVVLLIPKFLVLNELGLYDSYAGMIVPILADAAGVFIMKSFFESIPDSIEEAARIDGAGTFRIYWSVVLPMATPALITLFILSFQGSWNELAHFIVASRDPELYTLTKGVATMTAGSLGGGTQFPLKVAAATLMTIPVALLFFAFQRRIMNTTQGAVKE